VVVVVEPDGERTMYPDRAACYELRADGASTAGIELLHVPVYGLLPELGSDRPVSALADDLRRLRMPLSVDVSSLQVIERLSDGLLRLFHELGPAVVFANRLEAHALGWGPHAALAGCTVVVKRGPDPALVLAHDSVDEVPAEPVDSVSDTTGAGDAFAAGYLVAVLAGHAPHAAARAGHRSAAHHLRRAAE
jgi:sugar/nucleoside kinase (ribokinase family)